MQKNRYFPLTLIAVAIISGCSTVPNQSLLEARSNYNIARVNPQITNLAPLELKDANDTLNKAEYAFSEDENTETVNHLAYVAMQKINIAQETTELKTAELAVAEAGSNRATVRLDARTAEVDAANAKIAQLKALNAQQTERGMMITLGDVLFSTNKAQLKSGGIRNVQKLADFLNQYPQYKVSVEGHTDSRGSDEYNQELSYRRADAVQMALMNMSIASDRINKSGYGEGFPVASNSNSGGQQLNRRVEIILSDENGRITSR
ncbi:OmpA family protein [Methylobacter psychrophilus]|uniref:OmpA family protein n=1 Tax=Methylobacter psychrophilus TaxID=96941 RepID=UPI0021D4ED0E|nr:OmpA family protein [Methylobacter psychrophilus]